MSGMCRDAFFEHFLKVREWGLCGFVGCRGKGNSDKEAEE